MRIFLIQLGDGPDLSIVNAVKEIKKRQHEIVYWVKFKKPFPVSDFPETIFHDLEDVLTGKPANGIDPDQFSPPGRDFIKKFFETESVILTMMNKKYSWMGISERKHVYYNFLRYWRGVIQKFKPDIIIFPVPPHTVYDFVIYSLAKALNIKTIMFEFTRINDRLLIINDFVDGSTALKEMMRNNREKKFSLKNLSPDITEYYQQQGDPRYAVMPPDMRQILLKHSGMRRFMLKSRIFWVNIKNLSFFERAINFLFKKIWKNLKKEYAGVQSTPDFNAKFIYVPLHYQPEGNTNTLGGVFVDQLLMVEVLSASTPKEWLIYVKEHPAQWLNRGTNFGDYRYQGHYKQMAKLKNVRVVPVETDSYKLINSSQAVATITGTAGWEAVLRYKPALTFGYPWYRNCPGVFLVSDTESCEEAIKRITGGFSINQQEIVNYLANFDKVSIQGYLESYCKDISKISEEENTINISNALILEIERAK